MKKIVFLLLILFTLSPTLFGQESSASENQTSESDLIDFQGEVLRWEEVPRAKKYQVSVEKLQDDDSWKKVKSYTTSKNYYNANLDPGEYRVSITSYNVLGKKGAPSDWVNFLVLGNQTPYIYYENFKRLEKYNAPVIYINKDNSGESVSSKGYITAASGQPENSFTVKGRNIFYSTTKFYLIPVEESINGGKAFDFANTGRQAVELTVLNRNSRTYKLNLQYDANQLSSGYYNLEAVNPDGSKYDVSILVIADEKLKITPGDFEIDERYAVRKISIPKTGTVSLKVNAKGINDNTSYFLKPANDKYSYPFDSQLQLEQIEGSVTSIKPNADGSKELTLTFDVENLRTSYYSFVARKNLQETDSFTLLVERDLLSDNEHKEKVDKVSTKLKKRTTNVVVTVKGKKLEEASAYSLVSEYKPEIDGNSKTKIALQPGKKPGTYTTVIDYSNLTIGNYGLQVDNGNGEFVYTFELDNHFKSSVKNMTNEEFKNTFYKPLPQSGTVNLEAQELSTRLFVTESKVVKYIPVFLPYMYFDMAYVPFMSDTYSSIDISFEVDLLNFGYFAVGTGLLYNPNTIINDGYSCFDFTYLLDFRLQYPGIYAAPYLTVGAGYKIFDMRSLSPAFKLDFDDFGNRNDLYVYTSAGMVLLSFLDFKYTLEYHRVLSDSKYFKDSVGIGCRFILRQPYYSTEFTNQRMDISGKSVVSGKELDLTNPKVTALNFTQKIEEINDCKDMPYVESITFSYHLKTIGPYAFANNRKLKNVKFDDLSTVKRISEGAFANDTLIQKITIPKSVVEIDSDAFAGWTEDQTIILDWTADDETYRVLPGLNNLKCNVYYKDYSFYEGY